MKSRQVFNIKTLKAKLKEKLARPAEKESAPEPEPAPAVSPEMTISKMKFKETEVKSPARNLTVGQLISIRRGDEDSEVAAGVVRVDEEIWIGLLRPVPEITLEKGEKIRIEAWDDEGFYTFHSIVQEGVSLPRPSLRISKPTTGTVVQRKKSDRSGWSVPFSFTIMAAEDEELRGKTIPYARTQEISLGAIVFESKLPLQKGDELRVRLTLKPSPRLLKLKTTVIRVTPLPASADSGAHRITLQIAELQPAEYNTLLLFLAKNDPASSDIPWVG